MDKKTTLSNFIYSSLLSITAFFIYQNFDYFQVDSLKYSQELSWFKLVNFQNSAIFPWIWDPISLVILKVFDTASLFAFYTFLISFAAYFYFTKEKQDKKIFPFLFTFSLIFSLILFFGFDTSIFKTLAYSLILINTINKRESLLRVIFFVALVSLCYSYGSLAFISTLLILVFCKDSQSTNAKLMLFLSFISLLLTSSLELPPYPDHSRTYEEHSWLNGTDALIGEAPVIRMIDRLFLSKAYYYLIAYFLLIIAFRFFTYKLSTSKKDTTRQSLPYDYFVFSFLSLSLIIDSSLLQEKFQLIGPIYSISRMVPLLVYYPLVSLIAAFALILSLKLINIDAYKNHQKAFLFFSLIIFGLINLSKNKEEISERKKLIKSFEAANQETRNLILSPSLSIFKKYGLEKVLKLKNKENYTFTPLSSFKAKLSASSNEDKLFKLLKNNPALRWSPIKGKQEGNEWVHLSLNKERKINALKLKAGAYHSDFPRGIQILYSSTCNPENLDFSDYKLAFEDKEWKGIVGFTTEGYPYLQSQSNVEIDFGQIINFRCLLIKQIGKTDNYDWSLSGIELALAKVQNL